MYEEVGTFRDQPVVHFKTDRVTAARALRLDPSVTVQRPWNAEGVPRARRRPDATPGLDAMRRRREAPGVSHPDVRRVWEQDERVRVVQAAVSGRNVGLSCPEL